MTGSSSIALLERHRDDPFARVRGRTLSAGDFLGHVEQLAAQLPDADHVFNLVQDRYRFTVAFVAILAAGKCNLLPPNPKPDVQARLAERFDRVAVLHDGAASAPGLPTLAFPALRDAPSATVPRRNEGDIAALSFTSGSTGEAKPVAKSLAMFRGAVALYLDTIVPGNTNLLATVPAQHMYGLELASLQPLWTPVTTSACKPLFPADVCRELAALPAPRVLITTPLHLRALLDCGLEVPAVERVICATAPLDTGLARRGETALGAPVLDVYGCSEAGCLATRRPALDEELLPLPGVCFDYAGDPAIVTAPHLDEAVPLADRILGTGDGRIRLAGRLGDLINVAGKRGSLSEITRLLLATPGVEDGAAFAPPTAADNQRPAAVYAGPATRRDIRRHLGRFLDDALVPRPLIQVDRLPRTDTSKLPREALLALYRQHRPDR